MPENGFYRWIHRKQEEKEELNELWQKEQQKDAFIAAISREMETRLDVIREQTELLLQQGQTEETKRLAQEILCVERGLQNIAEDISDFSELEQGNAELNEQDYDLSAILKDTLHMAMLE